MKKEHRKTGCAIDHENREKDDYYNTPTEAVLALLEREKFEGAIWEPACGEGHISKALEGAGYAVISSDLVDRGYGEPKQDFLMEYIPRAPNIVTNPPFKLALHFILKSISLTTGKVAMFLPLAYLSGGARKKNLWDIAPLKTVYVFSYRVKSNRNGQENPESAGGMINFAWYVFDHGYKGRPEVAWI